MDVFLFLSRGKDGRQQSVKTSDTKKKAIVTVGINVFYIIHESMFNILMPVFASLVWTLFMSSFVTYTVFSF